jgi:hypothetical protein
MKVPWRIIRSRRLRGREPAYRPQLAALYDYIECRHCSGGVQWLHPHTGWGKIPKHMLQYVRSEDGGFDVREPTYSNLRSCPECTGRGVRPRLKKECE